MSEQTVNYTYKAYLVDKEHNTWMVRRWKLGEQDFDSEALISGQLQTEQEAINAAVTRGSWA